MKTKTLQDFKGAINGAVITDEMSYFLIKDFLTKLENKFGEIYNDDFIEDLAILFSENLKWLTSDIFDMHKTLLEDLEKANKFYDFKISIIGNDEYNKDAIKSMNNCLNGLYYYKDYDLYMEDKEK